MYPPEYLHNTSSLCDLLNANMGFTTKSDYLGTYIYDYLKIINISHMPIYLVSCAICLNEDLTTLQTRYEAYRYKVVPFGLTNGPSTFQRYINNTFQGYLDEFCTAYIGDILIFSKNKKEHEEHVRKVQTRLREAGLQAEVTKCEFDG